MTVAQKRASIVRRELDIHCPKARMILRYSNNWELLVAVMLSAQCTDKKVNEVTERLFAKYKTLSDYAHADPKEFEQDIFQTGFYKNKTKHVLAAAQKIQDDFGGEIPRTMAEMLTIPGVARKTANVVLGNAYNIVEGIAVDTHVKRLSTKFGLTTHENTDKIEQDLMKLLPKDEWFAWTYKIIDYGRHFSPARLKAHTDPISQTLKDEGLL